MAHLVTIDDADGNVIDARWYCSDACARADFSYAGWNGCHVVSTDYGLITCGNCQASIGGEVTE